MFSESEGAYTGVVSAQMLHAVGCSHVIIGHSERRQYFGETDDTKPQAARRVASRPCNTSPTHTIGFNPASAALPPARPLQ
jgi:triosephosphate isomerase